MDPNEPARSGLAAEIIARNAQEGARPMGAKTDAEITESEYEIARQNVIRELLRLREENAALREFVAARDAVNCHDNETAPWVFEDRMKLLEVEADLRVRLAERFGVTPKPAVTLDELGRMVIGAYQGPTFDRTMIPAYSARSAGQRMVDQLAQHGLAIVRVEAEE